MFCSPACGLGLAPCSHTFPVLCCTRRSAGPCGSRLSGWGLLRVPQVLPGEQSMSLNRRVTCVSLGMHSWGLKFLMVSGGLHSHSLLEPVDRGGGDG